MHDDETPKIDPPLLEVESSERWLTGKSKDELLVDLKAYLARLRDNPRSIPDRLRVAAIQLRLGRAQEALVHYEGVIRGYVQEGRVMNAIALCQRILATYPDFPRITRILAALYARAPHGATQAASPVTPVSPLEDKATTTFVLEDEEATTDRNVEVERVFAGVQERQETRQKLLQSVDTADVRTTEPYPNVGLGIDDLPTSSFTEEDVGEQETAVLLTKPKGSSQEAAIEPAPPEADTEMVVLLTRRKKK